MNNKAVVLHILNWLKGYMDNSKRDISAFIVGVSGGIDSALVSKLCALTGKKTIVTTLPIRSPDISLSLLHCKQLVEDHPNVTHYEIDLSNVYDNLKDSFTNFGFSSDLGLANTKARMRMLALYQIAASSSGIVVGTGNKVEDFGVGFYTKYGDGGVDISPIADLTKSEVRLLAAHLKIHEDIIKAPPTDGLWEDGRSDEQQLGLSYEEIEEAMMNPDSKHYQKYMRIREDNLHKMNPIPVCIIDEKIKTS